MVKILSIDPSLSHTGLVILNYNDNLSPEDPTAYKITHCQVVSKKQLATKKNGVMQMIWLLDQQSKKQCYQDCDLVLVESPTIMFKKEWSTITLASMSHVAGACIALFGVEKCYIFRPGEWNKSKKKQVTHYQTGIFLGDPAEWHYEKPLRSDKYLEHVMDAASMGLWFIKENYKKEE